MDIVCESITHLSHIGDFEEIIKDELNVKRVYFTSDTSKFATISAKPNFKKLGPKFGPLMKKASEIITNLSNEQINECMNAKLTIVIDGEEV